MSKSRITLLPPSLAPRGLSRPQAAEYVGVSTSLFDEMVRDGRMPKAKTINSRTIWDRLEVDRAFSNLPGGEAGGDGEWDVET
ncbi:MAG: helix-turn-helix transcriptional regulator [Rhizobiaceae bacterium]